MRTTHSVAPTQKIDDDAPIRPSGAHAHVPSGEVPRYVSQPPQMPAPSIPPTNTRGSQPAYARAPTPQPGASIPRADTDPAPAPARPSTVNRRMSSPAIAADSLPHAMPAPGRRWGLIVVVLLLDIGLAAAGAWMLNEGLATKPAPAPASPGASAAPVAADPTAVVPSPTPTTAATATAATATPNPSPTPAPPPLSAVQVTSEDPPAVPVAADPPAEPLPAAIATPDPVTTRPAKVPAKVKTSRAAKRRARTRTAAPLDPYGDLPPEAPPQPDPAP